MSEPVVLEKGLTKDSSKKESTLFWNLYAKCQDSLYNLIPYRKLLWDCLQALDLKPGMKLLDVGCGTGNFEQFLEEKGINDIEIEALESSPTRLALAERKCKNLKLVNFQRANLNQSLSYANDAYDAVISINVVSYVRNPKQLLDELNRVVKPGGKIVISKPKIKPKNLPVAFEHINRLKNVWSFPKKAKTIVNTVKAAPLLSLNPVLSNIAARGIKKTNNLSEKDLVDFSHESNYKGLSISPAYSHQGLIANIKPHVKEDLVYPIRFKVVETKKELEEACKLRFKVYCQEKGYLEAQTDCLGIERDAYDPFSIHFIALDGQQKIIGTSRLILNSNIGFPIQKYFGIKNECSLKKTAEKSRLIIKANGRLSKHNVASGLYKISVNYALSRGIIHWYAILDRPLFLYFTERIGFPFRVMGQSKECMGGITAPYLLDLNEMMRNLRLQNIPMYEYFKSASDALDSPESKRNLIKRRELNVPL